MAQNRKKKKLNYTFSYKELERLTLYLNILMLNENGA